MIYATSIIYMYILCVGIAEVEDPLAPAGESLARQIPVSWVCVCTRCVLYVFYFWSLSAAYKTHGATTTTKGCNVITTVCVCVCVCVWYGFLLWEKAQGANTPFCRTYGAFIIVGVCYPAHNNSSAQENNIIILYIVVVHTTHTLSRADDHGPASGDAHMMGIIIVYYIIILCLMVVSLSRVLHFGGRSIKRRRVQTLSTTILAAKAFHFRNSSYCERI